MELGTVPFSTFSKLLHVEKGTVPNSTKKRLADLRAFFLSVDDFESCVRNQGLGDFDALVGLVVLQDGGNYTGQSQG